MMTEDKKPKKYMINLIPVDDVDEIVHHFGIEKVDQEGNVIKSARKVVINAEADSIKLTEQEANRLRGSYQNVVIIPHVEEVVEEVVEETPEETEKETK